MMRRRLRAERRSQRVGRTISVVAAALVVAGLAAACVPKPSVPVGSPPQGFDACAAPTTTTMSTWWQSSPYTSVGVYIGGANRGCAQPNLNRSWVATVEGQGWTLLPLWVGPQAPCTTLTRTTKIPFDPTQAWLTGLDEARKAADAADALGFTWFDPIYFNLEAYPRGGACSAAVQMFVDGWTVGLNQRVYLSGLYSSLCSGILDMAAVYGAWGQTPLNAVWIAAWNNTPNIYNFGPPCALSNAMWDNHRRVHQFTGGHNETWGNVTINIDSNAVDGPVTYR